MVRAVIKAKACGQSHLGFGVKQPLPQGFEGWAPGFKLLSITDVISCDQFRAAHS